MTKPRELEGQKFGDWTVLKLLGYSLKDGTFTTTPPEKPDGRWWLCECMCGLQKPVSQSNLKQGVSRSCFPCSMKKRVEATRRRKQEQAS